MGRRGKESCLPWPLVGLALPHPCAGQAQSWWWVRVPSPREMHPKSRGIHPPTCRRTRSLPLLSPSGSGQVGSRPPLL